MGLLKSNWEKRFSKILIQSSTVLALDEGKPMVTDEFLSMRVSYMQNVSVYCNDVIMEMIYKMQIQLIVNFSI